MIRNKCLCSLSHFVSMSFKSGLYYFIGTVYLGACKMGKSVLQ